MTTEIINPKTGKPFRFGMRAMTAAEKAKYGSIKLLKFEDYLPGGVKGPETALAVTPSVTPGVKPDLTFPTAPTTGDYSTPASAAGLAAIYGNDVLNDCVIACCGHVMNVIFGTSNPPVATWTDTEIENTYTAWCGYDGTEPGPGCAMLPCLESWQSGGFPASTGNPIYGYVQINFSHPAQLRSAAWLFENLLIHLDIDGAWVTDWSGEPGFSWDVETPPWYYESHCVAAYGWTAGAMKIDSWGVTGEITDAAIYTYGIEVYSVLSEAIIEAASQKSPLGLNWAQLKADLAGMGGT